MEPVAQTNVALFNQLRRAGYTDDQLRLVQRAYLLAVRLNPGYFQASGKPFVSHTVGVASILAALELPAPVVAAACIHNLYVSGDFGDGLKRHITPARRQLVREAVGSEVEGYVHRFCRFRLTADTVPAVLDCVDGLDACDRALIAMDLADVLEKYTDQSILYLNAERHESALKADRCLPELVELALRLGHPQLAAALECAVRATAEDSVPEYLVSRKPYSSLVVARSCRRRLGLQALVDRIRRRLFGVPVSATAFQRDELVELLVKGQSMMSSGVSDRAKLVLKSKNWPERMRKPSDVCVPHEQARRL